jgi:hypothetical protein
MIVEYGTWTSVANVPFSDESTWLPLNRHLESEYSELGPVATWEDDASTIVLVLADDQPDPATAAENAARVVSDALHASGLADRFPMVFQVEAAADLLSV